MDGRFSKKNVVFVAVIIGVILIGVAFIFSSSKNNAETTAKLQINNVEKIVSQTVSVDSDGDGLKDWEEALLKTDPHNPDTDGDGTTDKDEIDQKRDPLVAGPDDFIKTSSTYGTNASATTDRTVTEDLAIELFTGYIKLKKDGNVNTINSAELIVSVINETVKSSNVESYSLEDVVVIKNPESDAISKYDAELTNILKPDPSAENDIVVLKRIVETENTSELAILDKSIERYGKIVSEMLLLSVPEPISTEHIAVVNALVLITKNIKSMRTVFIDPLKALVGVSGYNDNERIFMSNLLTIGEYLKLNRVLN